MTSEASAHPSMRSSGEPPISRPPISRPAVSRPGLLLLLLAVGHLAFSIWINPPGYLTFDSGTYHYMAKTLATTGGFVVQNGYEEFPSKALEVAQLRVNGGRLVAQYPEFLSFLGYPFYLLFGYPGLLLLNAVAFLGINALIFALARLLFDSIRTSYLAVVVYSFGTFAWEYSQSSYPHLSSTLFILASYYLLALAVIRRRAGAGLRSTVLLTVGSGLIAGFALGLRLDAAFAIPGLFFALLFAGRFLLPELLALAAGVAPGILFLSVVNSIKFDTWSPFSYGGPSQGGVDVRAYIPVSFVALVALAVLLALRYGPAAHRTRIAIVVAAGLALAVLARPTTAWNFVSKVADGAFQLIVDLRVRDMDIEEPALTRTDGGAMVYMGGVKKTLLQSCPYLVILLFVWADAVRKREKLEILIFLSLVPAGFLAYYAFFAWHGSIALNMRYLNPALPFLAILSAYAWSAFEHRISPRVAVLFSATLLLGLGFLFAITDPSLEEQEVLFLTTPLLIASAICIFEFIRRLGRWRSVAGTLVSYLLLTAFAWSGSVAFGRDYPTSTQLRRANLDLANVIRPYIQNDSLIVSDMTDCCWKLIDEVRDLRLADPFEDDYRSFDALVRFHLDRGRAVYLAYSPGKFEELFNSGRLSPFKFRMLGRWIFLGRPELALFEIRAR